jgi:hypothetical protein
VDVPSAPGILRFDAPFIVVRDLVMRVLVLKVIDVPRLCPGCLRRVSGRRRDLRG